MDPLISDTLNCGCPVSCDATALAKRTDGLPFSCQERIEYLMTIYGDSQSKACSAAVQSRACGFECDPNQCTAKNGFVEHDEDEDPSDSLNCGCLTTCDAIGLAKHTDGLPFSCREHLLYLMTRYGNSQTDACSIAVQGGACGPDCDPDRCESVKECQCVDCSEDIECGGLWKGDTVGGDPYSFQSISIVVSHCLSSLEWLPDFSESFPVKNVTIISKCGKPVIGAPNGSIIVQLDNIGRCDHSYAYWISEHMKHTPLPNEDKEVVVFLKDDRSDESIHQYGVWRSMYDMLRIASKTGFACGMKPTTDHQRGQSLSSYHDVETLSKFKMVHYSSMNGKYQNLSSEHTPFASNYSSLGKWASSIGIDFQQDLVNVCYAGTFAATVGQMRKQKETIWGDLKQSLARGNNIEEGHYTERIWASLLSDPLLDYQVMSLRRFSDGVRHRNGADHGPLFQFEKI